MLCISHSFTCAVCLAAHTHFECMRSRCTSQGFCCWHGRTLLGGAKHGWHAPRTQMYILLLIYSTCPCTHNFNAPRVWRPAVGADAQAAAASLDLVSLYQHSVKPPRAHAIPANSRQASAEDLAAGLSSRATSFVSTGEQHPQVGSKHQRTVACAHARACKPLPGLCSDMQAAAVAPQIAHSWQDGCEPLQRVCPELGHGVPQQILLEKHLAIPDEYMHGDSLHPI